MTIDKTSANNDDFIAFGSSATNNTGGPDIWGNGTVVNAGMGIGSFEFEFTASANQYLWLGASTSASDNGVRKFDNVDIHAVTTAWTDVDYL